MTLLTDIQPAPPFSIGLKPLQAEHFLQIDDELPRFRSEKQSLCATKFDDVCMAEKGTDSAQREVEQLIHSNLMIHHPQLYRFEGQNACLPDGTTIASNPTMPLASTALLVQDDLVLMRRDETGWRLVAASLCFPSSWNLQEKFGKPLEIIHGPVPLSEKMVVRINRIFDGLQPTVPVWRANWSLDGDGDLRHDRVERHRLNKREKLAGRVYFRTEYQTLHKLPVSGDILFTIRIKTGPLADLLKLPDGREKIGGLHTQYLSMTDAERNYKGINHNAERLLCWFEQHGKLEND